MTARSGAQRPRIQTLSFHSRTAMARLTWVRGQDRAFRVQVKSPLLTGVSSIFNKGHGAA